MKFLPKIIDNYIKQQILLLLNNGIFFKYSRRRLMTNLTTIKGSEQTKIVKLIKPAVLNSSKASAVNLERLTQQLDNALKADQNDIDTALKLIQEGNNKNSNNELLNLTKEIKESFEKIGNTKAIIDVLEDNEQPEESPFAGPAEPIRPVLAVTEDLLREYQNKLELLEKNKNNEQLIRQLLTQQEQIKENISLTKKIVEKIDKKIEEDNKLLEQSVDENPQVTDFLIKNITSLNDLKEKINAHISVNEASKTAERSAGGSGFKAAQVIKAEAEAFKAFKSQYISFINDDIRSKLQKEEEAAIAEAAKKELKQKKAEEEIGLSVLEKENKNKKIETIALRAETERKKLAIAAEKKDKINSLLRLIEQNDSLENLSEQLNNEINLPLKSNLIKNLVNIDYEWNSGNKKQNNQNKILDNILKLYCLDHTSLDYKINLESQLEEFEKGLIYLSEEVNLKDKIKEIKFDFAEVLEGIRNKLANKSEEQQKLKTEIYPEKKQVSIGGQKVPTHYTRGDGDCFFRAFFGNKNGNKNSFLQGDTYLGGKKELKVLFDSKKNEILPSFDGTSQDYDDQIRAYFCDKNFLVSVADIVPAITMQEEAKSRNVEQYLVKKNRSGYLVYTYSPDSSETTVRCESLDKLRTILSEKKDLRNPNSTCILNLGIHYEPINLKEFIKN